MYSWFVSLNTNLYDFALIGFKDGKHRHRKNQTRVQGARRVNQGRPPAAINGDDALWLVAGNMLDQAQAEIDRLNDVVTELTCELREVNYDS